jgi:hypothetical protein
MSGDDAAWRELIAQYDLPASPDPAAAPWPERENLDIPPAGLWPAGTGQSGPEKTDTNGETESPEADDSPDASAAGTDSPAATPPGDPQDSGDSQAPRAGSDRTRVIRYVSPVWRPATDAAADDEEDDRYVPPPPPPLPRLDSVAKGAWAALIGGPLYLLLATLLGWQVSGVVALAAVAAFVGGFAVMIFRMGDGPSRGDGPDNGAVV